MKLAHTPAGASIKQLAHYGQGISGKQFERYDHGWLENRRLYGSSSPPRYDLSKIKTPVFLHYSAKDPLAHVDDVDRLWRELGSPVGKFKIQHPTFSHLDFTWGIDAKTLVYDRVINFMRQMDIHG